jgi:hypothetical protein
MGKNGMKFQITKFFLITTFYSLIPIFPTYGQSFEALVNELSGSNADQVASEEEEIIKKKEDKPSESSPPEIKTTTEEDEFAPEENIVTNGVTLQGLDKQTARVFIIDAAIGQAIEFGNLKIIVRHCEKAPLADRQESMAFLTIMEEKSKGSPKNLFAGWMFASSPALSALDHPIYDVWVKECKTVK